MDTYWKKVKRSGNFRRKVNLRLQKILEESESQITGNNSVIEQSSSTGETPVNKTDTKSEEAIIVNADYEEVSHNWDVELDEENFTEIGGPQLAELLDGSINLRNKIREWAITYSISHMALKDLLHIWNHYSLPNKLLPSDPRTLLNTPRNIILDSVGINGNYWHQGMELCLKKYLHSVEDIPQTISININVDGLPIYKSSRKEFWPILFNIYELPARIKPMVIGIYYGYGKPSDVNKFLQPFVTETMSILQNGVTLNYLRGIREKTIFIKIRSFICDSPARAFVKGEY